jgi:hypothetical protein
MEDQFLSRITIPPRREALDGVLKPVIGNFRLENGEV